MAFTVSCSGVSPNLCGPFHAGQLRILDLDLILKVLLCGVDVDGAVVSPGVYRLKDGARVAQAIDAAGGLAPEADVTGFNRASKVTDGQKIHVPTVGEQQASIAEAGVDGGASASLGVSGATGLVNINTASAAELQTLSGIGPSMAQSIIDERTKNGAFASVDDLMRVSGIGEKKLAKIKDCICV